MPAGEDGDHQLIDHFVLPDDDPGQLCPQAVVSFFDAGQVRQVGVVGRNR